MPAGARALSQPTTLISPFSRIYSGMVSRTATRTGLISLLLTLGCAPRISYQPDPARDVESWVANFRQQRSLRYQFSMKTTLTRISGRGVCVLGRGEQLREEWTCADSTTRYEYVGLGDIEYQRQPAGGWKKTARGEESNILAQINRMLEFDKFEYAGDDDAYRFTFRANVPFLAPTKYKELKGQLIISRRHYRPEFIWAGLPDSSVWWQVSISGYNKNKTIRTPSRAQVRYFIQAAETTGLKPLAGRIKKRLKILGISHRAAVEDSFIVLETQEQYTVGDIEDFLSSPLPFIYGMTDQRDRALLVTRPRADPKKELYVDRVIADRAAIESARIGFDRRSRPYVEIVLKKKVPVPATYCLELDGTVVSINTLDRERNLNKLTFYIEGQDFPHMNQLRSSIICPLPPLQIKELDKGTY